MPEYCEMNGGSTRKRTGSILSAGTRPSGDHAVSPQAVPAGRAQPGLLLELGRAGVRNPGHRQVCRGLLRGRDRLHFGCADGVGREGSAQGYRVIEPLWANSQVEGPVWSSGYSPMGKTEIAVSAGAADPEWIYRMLDWLASPGGAGAAGWAPGPVLGGAGRRGHARLQQGVVCRRAGGAGGKGPVRLEHREESGFCEQSPACRERPAAEARKDRKTVWKAEVLDRHSCDISRLQNISPTCDGLENTAKILCGQLVESYLPRIVGAKEESEALYYLTELNHQVDQAGFQFVLSHYNWQYANSSGESGIERRGNDAARPYCG